MESSDKATHDDFGLEEPHEKVKKDKLSDERLKKQHSYTYWVQNNKEQFPQHLNKDIIMPKKIDDPELLKKLEEQTTQMKTGSAWNKAGTWEDKKLKVETLQEYFQNFLVGNSFSTKSGEVTITEIENISGEASVVMVRGKKRMGFELEIKIKFKGAGQWDGIEGAIEYNEVCDDGSEGDHKLFVQKEKNKDQGRKFKEEASSSKLMKQLIDKIRETLAVIRDEV